MTENLDPVRTSSEITAAYRRYLGSLIATRDPKVGVALERAIDGSPMLDKGPFLEATPPYAPGATLRELVDQGVLAGGFAHLGSAAMPLERPLYRHQEASIRKARAGRNIVVATGTGSGKTESFLLPILDALVREQEAGTLGPGVRALLLYPMNALANDQMKRLRSLLHAYRHITFGRYTGDTENDPQRARDSFEALNPSEQAAPNELLSRDEMRATPPHILLTNYAMLEYLLLRPQDMALFPDSGPQTWRFLVVDEAHVYDGTQGAEIGLLLRRLRDRVAPHRDLQCIATSATVGAESDARSVTEFASRLFGVPFEWEEGDPGRQDLITAQRVDVPQGPFWGPLSAHDYQTLLAAEDTEAAVLTLANAHRFVGESAASVLAHEKGLADLKRILRAGPQPFRGLVDRIFPNDADGRNGLVAMVAVASRVRTPDGSPALSARYHLFLRATEGAFLCLSDSGPHVHLARHELCEDCHAPVFELGACRRCGAVHLLGTQVPRSGRPTLQPRSPSEPTTWLVLGGSDDLVDEDEEVMVGAGDVQGEKAKLCPQCRTLSSANAATCESSGCGATALREVSRLKKRGQDLAGCLVCGGRGAGTVRAFETGSDAASAVIATSLYQALPSSDDLSELLRPGEGRKLLMFSDSRQAAAFFAPYLEDTYGRLQRRRLVYQGLVRAGAAEALAYPEDVIAETRACADQVRQFSRRVSRSEQNRTIAPWVMAEVVSVDDRQSLEGVGLVRMSLDRDPAWPTPSPLLALGLSGDEAWDFMSELVRTLRMQGAVTMPENVAPNDDIFAPRLGPIFVREDGPEARQKVLSWLPARGTNRRIAYVTKVLTKLGRQDVPRDVLRGIWRFLTGPTPVDWLARTQQRGLGELRQVDHQLLRFRLVTDDAPVFVCDTCQRVSPASVRGVCPALSCAGTLQPFVPPTPDADRDHYRAIYRGMHAVPLKAMEHTAQWQNTEAARIQQEFIRGEVNALSCSTTFELGVDVGELQAVMLRNVPPSTANYIQRAGRAGRRAGAAALVVTYAQRRSHDLTHFAAPEVLMKGTIRTPYVPLDNERIDRRHAYSVALSAFFRWDLANFHRISRKAGEFFLGGDGHTEPPVMAVRGFLTPQVPHDLTTSLERVLPDSVKAEIGVQGGSWVNGLLRLLDQVTDELGNDIQNLTALRDAAVAASRYSLAERYQQVMKTILGRDLLGFLANHNVIPKYGFPVDTVELRTDFGAGATVGRRLELSRDLSQAIHEYAPEATLVAGGQLWTGRGIYRLPGKELERYNYRVCEFCGHYSEAIGPLEESQCPICNQVPRSGARAFLVPEFGFVADPNPGKVGIRPPQSSWSGTTHVVKLSDQATERTVALPGGRIEVSVGPRGRLISLSDGPGGSGYWICDWCGWGTTGRRSAQLPRQHDHLLRAGTTCTGSLSRADLAHRYETDILSLAVRPNYEAPVGEDTWKSVLYAVLEAGAESQQISRDDIDGAIRPTGRSERALVLFDTVPGGGGNVLRISERLKDVLAAALHRVASCECGPETSCYGCLRGYRNQRYHEVLSRGAAEDLLVGLGVRGG